MAGVRGRCRQRAVEREHLGTEETGRPAEEHTRGDNRWLHALSTARRRGRLDRQRLLDASLDALMRDFRASTVGWYAKLHEELEPTRTERVERLDRYMALVTSPAPVVARRGLAALARSKTTCRRGTSRVSLRHRSPTGRRTWRSRRSRCWRGSANAIPMTVRCYSVVRGHAHEPRRARSVRSACSTVSRCCASRGAAGICRRGLADVAPARRSAHRGRGHRAGACRRGRPAGAASTLAGAR